MKLVSKLSAFKKYFLLVFLALFAVLIWKCGSGLVIAHHLPFREPQKRLALILALFLAWSIKYLLWDFLQPPEVDKLSQLLHALQGRFLGALRFLKKTVIDKHGFSTPLHTLPWYLLIGPPGSGKTTLLNHSHINFILSKQKKTENLETSSAVCDWWVTRDLVLVDVPGYYAFSPAKDILPDTLHADEEQKQISAQPHVHLALWQSLLKLLIKYRQKNNIAALVLTLHLPELIKLSRQQQTQWFQDLKQRLLECWAKFGNIPVYFFVTKCDLLPGFSEFFNDMGSDELLQPWGIPLSGQKDHEKLLDLFTDRFNALIKRLNKQLIWRLHQERNALLRPLIKDFPLQLEYIKETLVHLIKTLSLAKPDLALEGVYLVSAAQENTATSTLFHHDLPSALEISPTSPFVSRAYFIKNLISYLLPYSSQPLIARLRRKKSRFQQLSYGTGFLLLFLSVFGLGQDFQHSLSQLSTVQRYLSQYQLFLQQNNNPESSISALTSALPLLNTLETATTTQADNSRLKQIKTPYSVKSQQTAIGIYHKALQTIVLPQIRNEFEKYLENSSDKNPEQLYAALKAYLLLRRQDSETAFSTGAAQVKQIPFIIQTLEQISPAFSKKSPIKELRQTIFLQHLQNALQLKPSNLLNNRLIKQVRKTLNSLPETDLAYLLIKNKNNNSKESELSLGTNIGIPPALISKGTLTQIPCLFTASVFGTVIQEELQEAADETINGNEVLGKKFYRSDALISSTEASTLLKQELEKKYINNYIDVWESLVDNISINLPKNLTETDALIMNLISTHSPLLQLLQTIHSNINLPPILTNSFKLQALNTLFNQTETQQKDSLYEIFTDLHELHQFLQQASLGELPEGSKLHNPISRIRNTAEKYPEPIKTWLQTLVSSTQNYLQQKSGGNENKKISIKEAALESNFQNLLVIPKPYLQTKQSLLLGADILA